MFRGAWRLCEQKSQQSHGRDPQMPYQINMQPLKKQHNQNKQISGSTCANREKKQWHFRAASEFSAFHVCQTERLRARILRMYVFNKEIKYSQITPSAACQNEAPKKWAEKLIGVRASRFVNIHEQFSRTRASPRRLSIYARVCGAPPRLAGI